MIVIIGHPTRHFNFPPAQNKDTQSFPYEHIPIGGRVCFAVATTIFTDSGNIVQGDYGTRVASQFVGIWIRWDYIKGKDVQIARRQLHYPIIET